MVWTYHDIVHVLVQIGLAAELFFQLEKAFRHLVIVGVDVVHVNLEGEVKLRELKTLPFKDPDIVINAGKLDILGLLAHRAEESRDLFINKSVLCKSKIMAHHVHKFNS